MEKIDEWCPNCQTQLREYTTLSDEQATYCPNYLCDFESRYEDYQVAIARQAYANGGDTLGFVFEGLEPRMEPRIIYEDNNTIVTVGKVKKELNQVAEIAKPTNYKIMLDNIIGYEGIKRRLRANINHKGRKKIHTLIVGAAGTSKTVFLKSLESELVPQGCNFHYIDCATMTKRGLLDYLFENDNIEVLALDEVDKVPKEYQAVFLNLLETGILQTTTFNNIRRKEVKNMIVVATANYLEKLIEPVRTRLFTLYVKAYDKTEYLYIAKEMLKKKYSYITDEVASYIAEQSYERIKPQTMRTVDRLGNLIRDNPTIEAVEEAIKDIVDYEIPEDVLQKLDKQT